MLSIFIIIIIWAMISLLGIAQAEPDPEEQDPRARI